MSKWSNNNCDSSDMLLSQILKKTNGLLSKREVEVMSLWLKGHSLKETARVLKIGLRAVEEYRSRVKRKLSIKNKHSLYELVMLNDVLQDYFLLAQKLQLNHQMLAFHSIGTSTGYS